MLEKEFIQYDRALALKELGFNESCFGYYMSDEGIDTFLVIEKCINVSWLTLAPTFSQSFRWFREKYDIEVKPMIIVQGNDKYYNLSIIKPLNDSYTITNEYKRLNTYEEAELACIDKLIEIVKEAKEL
jgi:hypothetical protein